MARTMLNDNLTPKHFWAKAVNTTCCLQNKNFVRPILRNSPYELCKGRKPNKSFFFNKRFNPIIVLTENLFEITPKSGTCPIPRAYQETQNIFQ